MFLSKKPARNESKADLLDTAVQVDGASALVFKPVPSPFCSNAPYAFDIRIHFHRHVEVNQVRKLCRFSAWCSVGCAFCETLLYEAEELLKALQARNAAVAALEKKIEVLEAQQEREQEQELSRTKLHFAHVETGFTLVFC